MTETLFTQTLDADSSAGGYTVVNRFLAAALTLPAANIVSVKFTLEAGSVNNCVITNCYVGHGAGSGDVYDFAATPVQVKWAGSAGKTITAGNQATSDLAVFAYDKSSPLLFAVYYTAGTNDTRYKATGDTNIGYYYNNINDAATVNKTGYSGSMGGDLLVAKIEAEVSAASRLFGLYY